MRHYAHVIFTICTLVIGICGLITASMIAVTSDINEANTLHVFVGSTAVGLNAVMAMAGAGFFLRRVMIDNFGVERKYREKALWKPAAFSITLLGAAAICFAHILFTETTERVLEASVMGTIMLAFASLFAFLTGIGVGDRRT